MASRKGRSVVELLLVAGAASAFTWVLTNAHVREELRNKVPLSDEAAQEVQAIAARYGGSRNSRNLEEWLIRDFFQDRRGGVFVDVGANHFQRDNNTYFLEAQLGWSGIAIDAQPEFEEGYRMHRPKTRFVAMFASNVPGKFVKLFVSETNSLVASTSQEFTRKEGAPGQPRDVPTTTLNVVLDQAGIAKIDFLSMDIELSEPEALAGFDIERFKPALACVEGHPEVRQQILDYFAKHGYTVVGKYLRADTENLYFTPLS